MNVATELRARLYLRPHLLRRGDCPRSLALLAIWILLIVCAGCAPTYAKGYQEALHAGLRAKNAGRFSEAISKFDEAAKRADRYKDREEARLLLAQTYERVGKPNEALRIYTAIVEVGEGRYHAVRAEFLLAALITRLRGSEAGDAATVRAVLRHPESGYTRHAIRRLLSRIEEEQGADEALARVNRLLGQVAPEQSLYEQIAYEKGLLLFKLERFEEAEAVLVATARAHPYPRGSLADDAYYQASLLREKRGDFDGAISLLEEMLRVAEKAYLGSSYDRPRFPQGQMRIAVLHRDRKADADAAVSAFGALVKNHSRSRFVDDALYAIAQIEHHRGRERQACAAAQQITEIRPDSRYNRCLKEVCLSARASAQPCPAYIVNHPSTLTPGRAPEPFAPATLPQ